MPVDEQLIFSVDNVPPGIFLGPVLLAAGIYLVLRWVVRLPGGGTSPVSVTQHALWVGVIGWLASSLQPAGQAGIVPRGGEAALSNPGAILPLLAWPVLGVLAVHALGQYSYPGPRLPRRQATLGVRQVRDFLPRPLAWTALAIVAVSAIQIGWLATLQGYAPLQYEVRPDGAGGFVNAGGDGRIPGIELAAMLGSALALLVAGTWLVLVLISRRRQVEALSPADNNTLRTIAMNRLLRTAATVASGLAAIAGNHAARPDPALGIGSWTNVAGLLNLVVLLAMWWWAPPKLSAVLRPAGRGQGATPDTSQPATRLVVSLGPAMALAALAPLVFAVLVPRAGTQPAVFVAVAAGAILAVVAGGETLLARNHSAAGLPAQWPPQPASPAILSTAATAAAALVAVIAVVAGRQSQLGVSASWPAAAVASACVLAFSALPLVLVRRRRGIPGPVEGLDAALRAITVHRVLRTLAAFLAVQAGTLLSFAAPSLLPAWPLDPGPWAGAWRAAPLAGVLLATAGVVIAVVPVRALAGHKAGRRSPAPVA